MRIESQEIDRPFGGTSQRGVRAEAKKEAESDEYAGSPTFRPTVQPARSAAPSPCKPASDLGLPAGRIVSSDTLFQGSREIGIEHYGSLYRLKITRQGKLILNK